MNEVSCIQHILYEMTKSQYYERIYVCEINNKGELSIRNIDTGKEITSVNSFTELDEWFTGSSFYNN